jgi:tape measure domain-containing protein
VALRDILVHFGINVDQSQLIAAQTRVKGLFVQLNQLQSIATFAIGALGARALAQSADQYIELENRLRAVTNSTQEFEAAQKGVLDIARQTARPVEDIAQLYQRYTIATSELGTNQAEVLDFTKRLTQATVLSGAGAAETRGALIQLAQGIGTNFKAAGQELRTIQEQAPLLAKIIAEAAGGSPGELLALAKAGKINAKLVFDSVRQAGAQLDKDFSKRKLRFEDVSVLFGIEWMQLIKQLQPMFATLIGHLVNLVTRTREWVADGSAMNSVIAAAIVTVGALSLAFSGLLAQIILVSAPLVLLFLLVEDFVTFMRGGKSVIGELFNSEGAEKFRETLMGISDALKGWLTAGDNDAAATAFADLFASRFKTAMQAAVDVVYEYALNKLRNVTGIHPAGPQDQRDINAIQDPLKTGGISEWLVDKYAEVSGFKDELAQRRAEGGWAPEMTGLPSSMPTLAPTPWAPMPVISGGQYGPPLPPSVINNTVTVQGNATPQTARDIARETGAATETALGRDRSAIGAGVGVFP